MRTLIEHWDGAGWAITPSPNPSDTWNQLVSVSVISSTDVWAVGTSSATAARSELVLHWDGQSWTQSSSPNSESNENQLTSVAAIAPDDVWAVGYYYISGYKPYALHYDGKKWTHFDMPMIGRNFHYLQSITAINTNNIWAVGYISSGFNESQYTTFIEHWDGATWDLVPSPKPGGHDNILVGVSATPDGSSIWATGWYRDTAQGPTKTLIARWNGSKWVIMPSPNASEASSDPRKILVLADDNVWVVGAYQDTPGGTKKTLVMHWDGNVWSFVPSDSPGTGDGSFTSVATNGNDLWAVGHFVQPDGTNTLAESFPLAESQQTVRNFPQTGRTVSGKFLQYWDVHGGLAQQGYPISEEMQEISDTDGKTYTVQYFERAEFELHPENASPNDVLLSLLGTFLYNTKYPNGAPGQQVNSSPTAVMFAETGHKVGGIFLTYWQEHGGLAQQGYPISDEFTEVSDLDGKLYLVQYFERAVLEWHPENQAPNDVLLSQLGTFRYRAKHGDQ
jgi:hypothetical protein